MRFAVPLLLLLGACAQPGPAVSLMPGDFGLVEITVAS